ncbi:MULTISPECIES: DUF6230 family protein [Embleya]|uniref:Cholesterol esterase n=2 Tax=Embleya TaxID=2699295 RepID=A0A1T3NWN2_9ACTN|nr:MULTISPECIES: DUF6230 family protein [Embleya]OPC81082.1 hypothetical protein B4N89_09070 [Embleya scabrispora]GCD95111.1 cholesterol esterase [Embleya hyalina]
MDKKVQAGSGKTRWKRFGIVLLPVAAMTVGMFAGVANGVVPVNITVGGGNFKVRADKMEATDFSQFGDFLKRNKGADVPVATAAIGHADITNLCQSVKGPFGIVLRIEAGGKGTKAEADNMTLSMDGLDGDAVFENIDIGVDASTMAKGSGGKGPATIGNGHPTMFGQQANKATFTDVKQSAWLVQAGRFYLKDLHLEVGGGSKECF